MISTMIALFLAMAAAQASDTTRASREAFNACLRNWINGRIAENMALEAFRAAYPQQCPAQQAAFRDAILRRETALRATRATAEQTAGEEVGMSRSIFAERFEYAVTPEEGARTETAAQTPAAPTPAAQPSSPQ